MPTKAANLEDAPIADVPATVSAKTPSSPVLPTPTANLKQNVPAEAAHEETEITAPDGHTIGWFDLGHTFQIDFLRHALFAGILVALMCSYLGVYVVLKRIVFVGVALAELSSAGIAVGLWLGFSPIWGAMLLVLLGVTMFAVRWSPRRVPSESTIGIVYSVAGALAILCISKSAMGETHMLKLLQGDVLTVAPQRNYGNARHFRCRGADSRFV